MEVVVTRSVSCLLFTPVGRFVSHHSVLFRLLVHHLNIIILPFLSISGCTLFNSMSRRRGGGGQKYIKPQEEKARRKQQMKKMMVTVREKLVVGYLYLVPMESGSDNSSDQDTATVTRELKEPSATKNDGFVVEVGELAKSKEISGETKESSGQRVL